MLLLTAVPINANAQQSGSCQPAYSTACQNLRSKDTSDLYNRIQSQNAQRQYQEYLRRNDYQNGVGQGTGPTGNITGGITADGGGAWVGHQWQWSTQ